MFSFHIFVLTRTFSEIEIRETRDKNKAPKGLDYEIYEIELGRFYFKPITFLQSKYNKFQVRGI